MLVVGGIRGSVGGVGGSLISGTVRVDFQFVLQSMRWPRTFVRSSVLPISEGGRQKRGWGNGGAWDNMKYDIIAFSNNNVDDYRATIGVQGDV